MACCSVCTICGGVPAGTNKPYQLPSAMPSTPDSPIVGMLGIDGQRLRPLTPSPLICPDATCCDPVLCGMKAMWTSPASSAVSIGASPR
jgi:hypothetical protein